MSSILQKWTKLKCNCIKFPSTKHLLKDVRETRGRIFSQAGNKLGASSFLARNELLNAFPLYLVPSWERACSQID
jgi:hypothetical protein